MKATVRLIQIERMLELADEVDHIKNIASFLGWSEYKGWYRHPDFDNSDAFKLKAVTLDYALMLSLISIMREDNGWINTDRLADCLANIDKVLHLPKHERDLYKDISESEVGKYYYGDMSIPPVIKT